MHSITQVLLLEILKYWRYPKILYLKILDKHIQATCSQHVVQLFHYTIKWVVKLWFLARSSMTNAASVKTCSTPLYVYSILFISSILPTCAPSHFLSFSLYLHSFSFIFPSFLQMFHHVPAPRHSRRPGDVADQWRSSLELLPKMLAGTHWETLSSDMVNFLDFSDGNLWDIWKPW